MLTYALAACFFAAPSASTAAASHAEAAGPLIVETGSGNTFSEPDPLLVDTNGGAPYRAVGDVPAIICIKHALRIFGGDRKQAVHLCKGGTGSMERVHCAEQLARYMAGDYESVAKACNDGGTPATSQCVIDAARLFQGAYTSAVTLCSHGGGPENYLCAKQGLIAMGGFSDDVIELCHNLRMPFKGAR
jgi:hypothetical protein